MIYSRYLSNSVKPSAPRPLYSRLHVFFTSLYPNRKVNDFKIDLYSHSTFNENVLECSRRMHPDVSSCKFYFLIHEKTYFCLTGSRISRSNITATQNYRSKQVRNGPSVNGSVLGPKMWSVFCFTKNRRQKCTFDCHQNLSPILVNWVSCIKMVNWLNLTLI